MKESSKKMTQTERVVDYLHRFGSITALEAMRNLGIMRLASRIRDLKTSGVNITSRFETVKNRFGEKTQVKRYFLN